MSADTELMQPELFSQDEPPCPGYDACPIGICGCRFLGLGTPFASDVKKGIIYADTALHGNDDGLLLTHREAITQTGNRDPIMNAITQEVTDFIAARRIADARMVARGRYSADAAARDERGYVLLETLVQTHPEIVAATFNSIKIGGTDQIILTAKQCGHNITVKGF
jgi:hypothetical protein